MHSARESPCDRGAIMREAWRRVVIGSAVVVYIAGLACAGRLLMGRIETGAGLPSLAALVPDPLAPPAGAGSRR
jgi:hypothetical protein